MLQIGLTFVERNKDFKEKGFILPLEEHWQLFKSHIISQKHRPLIYSPEDRSYSFVQFEKVKDFISLWNEFPIPSYYYVLQNDCDMAKKLKIPPNTFQKLIGEGFVQ